MENNLYKKLEIILKYIIRYNYFNVLQMLKSNYNDIFKQKYNINLKNFDKYNKINSIYLTKIVLKYITDNKENKDIINKLLLDILIYHPDKDIILKYFNEKNKENNVLKIDGETKEKKENKKENEDDFKNEEKLTDKNNDDKTKKIDINKYVKYIIIANLFISATALMISFKK